MKRRTFLKTSAATTAGMLMMPYLLPSGRLFASTGQRKVNHVVFCMFAGGVRSLESVYKAEGNLMPNTLSGNENISPDLLGGMSSLPTAMNPRLQQLGTLFREFRYRSGPTGHFNGHTTSMTGHYTQNDIQLRQPPAFPTIFELYRKHHDPLKSALNAWWISDSLGPYPYLNYSSYPGYGADFGANMIQPFSLFRPDAFQGISQPRAFLDDEKTQAEELRAFFNSRFKVPENLRSRKDVENSLEDRLRIQDFILQEGRSFNTNPFGVGNATNGDMINIHLAIRVMQQFLPELLIVNIQNIDIGHTNYTAYCDNIRKADFALARLWQAIQSTPGMANDTVLIVAPEHGRNLNPNTLRDAYGRFALDHTNDEMARRVFCLIAGPPHVVKQNQVISNEAGESIDIAPTIAHILGFKDRVPGSLLPGRVLQEALV